MFYNSDTESFWYYSKNNNVSNRTLDAVARKYTITHDCKQVCINHKKEIEKVQNKLRDLMIEQVNKENNLDDVSDKKEQKTGHGSAEKDEEDSVFVKPKITTKKLIRRHKRVILDRVNRFFL